MVIDCADAWNNKGESLRRQGKYDEAIKSLDKAIEINPRYAYAWYNRGLALFNVKPYEDDDLKHLVY